MTPQFLARRFLSLGVVVLVVSFLTFTLLELAPGDAAQVMAGDSATPDQIAALRQEMGLNAPLITRYLRFAERVILHGDLGRSLVTGRPVADMILARFRYSLWLGGAAGSLAVVVGMAAGWAAARRPGGLIDLSLMTGSALGLALPSFWLALMLVMVFSLRLGWLPVFGAGSWKHIVLPAVCLALPTAAMIARLARASLLEASQETHTLAAKARGLSDQQVWVRHILRNGLVPVVTMLGVHLGHILGGAFIIETIFAWPGLGRMVVLAIFDQDLPLILGAVLLMSLIVQSLNLAVDLAHKILDPRVGLSG